jgi:beta-lactam-binding protein with PASTA domain
MSTWTYRTTLGSGFGTHQTRSRNGTTVCFRVGTAYRSADGGTTWSAPASLLDGGAGSVLAPTAGKWNIAAYPGFGCYVSTDDGLNYNNISSGFISAQSSNAITDGAGSSIFLGAGSAVVAWSTDSGATWHNTSSPPWAPSFPSQATTCCWDGTQFVMLLRNGSALDIYTAPGGFSSGTGPVWTLAQSGTPAAGAIISAALVDGNVAYLPGVGYIATCVGNFPTTQQGIVIASTLAGLYTAPVVTPTGWTSGAGVQGVWAANGAIFVAESNGKLHRSTDGGTTWSTETTNLPTSTSNVVNFAFDSVATKYIVINAAGEVSNADSGVLVPNVVGQLQATAQANIISAGYTVGVVSTGTSLTVPLGYVISQNPVGGVLDPPGTAVDLVVSSGPPSFTVPSVVGYPYPVAVSVLSAVTLVVGTVTDIHSETVPPGSIIAQAPLAGTPAFIGQAINLTRSLGSSFKVVPNIVGDTISAAAQALLDAGLLLGDVTIDTSGAGTVGAVVSQGVPAGALVQPGTRVSAVLAALVGPFNVDRTVISQYANSPTLLRLVHNMQDYIDPRANLTTFYDYVWNVDTAVGFGLDIWGRIVGVSRLLKIPNTANLFGFENSDIPPDWQPFNQGTFYTGAEASQAYLLPDDVYRTLILTKALANIVATSAASLNQLLRNLFPNRGRCYVIDNGGMSMSFKFEFALSDAEYAILTQSGALPHPAGVAYDVIVAP